MKYSVDIERGIDALLYCLNKVKDEIDDIWRWGVSINASPIDSGIYFNFDADNEILEICNSPAGDDIMALDDIITIINEEEYFYNKTQKLYEQKK